MKLTDCAALLLAWFSLQVSRRTADRDRTYGYQRFEVLAAFVNGIALFVIVAWIFYEAVHRFLQPVKILGGIMLVVAVLGLAVNVAAFFLLHGGDRSNLNLRGAAAHVLGDLFGSIGAIVAAIVILTTGWTPIDPLLSVLVGLLIIKSAWSIVADSAHILLEGTPRSIDIERLSTELQEAFPEVRDVHHVHAWSLTPGQSLVTLHVTVYNGSDQDAVLEKVSTFLEQQWQIEHSTIQVEQTNCPRGSSGDGRIC